MPNRVLLIDDDDRVRKSLRAFLQRRFGFRICGEVADVRDAIEKVPDLKPDLIVLEVSMGIEATHELKKILPRTSIILFTMYESLLRGFHPAEIGLDAVVAKDSGVSGLGEAVKRLFSESRREWPDTDATRLRALREKS